MKQILIKNAKLVNEGVVFRADLLIRQERIHQIGEDLTPTGSFDVVNAEGCYVLPGMIDAHVHFREPGLTYKGNIASESAAAVAGGVTSVLEMPNTLPPATSIELLEEKFRLAATNAHTNFSFFFGVNQHNFREALRVNNQMVCGITDDGLHFEDGRGGLCNRPDYLIKLFNESSSLIALHCEDEETISTNIHAYYDQYQGHIPYAAHGRIRSEAACVKATARVLELAKNTPARLHILHVSTAQEAKLIATASKQTNKRITGEVCIHHLVFSDRDYAAYGSHIVWNPSVKTEENRDALIKALEQGELNFVATDHAPHALSEKQGAYLAIKPGAPSIQHALRALLELYQNKEEHLPFIVSKTSHQVANAYCIRERGFLREGYYADLTVVSLEAANRAEEKLYHCGWSPFYGRTYHNSIRQTYVNGNLAFDNGVLIKGIHGKRILFDR